MFETLFGPLARIRKRLSNIDKIVRLEEVILRSKRNPRDKIDLIKRNNRSIRTNIERLQDLFLGKVSIYRIEKSNERLIAIITADIRYLLDELEKIEAEITKDETELRSMTKTDPEFVNEWVKELFNKYSKIITEIDIIEKNLRALKEPDKSKIRSSLSEAQEVLAAGRLVTKSRELKRIARASGYDLEDKKGTDHTIVRSKGKKITEIPNHTNISVPVAKNILKALALGEFVGRKSA